MSQPALLPDDSRACPFCGETIKKVAVKCRHCGELLGGDDAPGVFRDGKRVVVSRTAALPPRCIKTNGPADKFLQRTLHWHPPAVYMLLLLLPVLGPIPYVIGAIAAQKKVRLKIPLSAARYGRRRLGLILAWLLALGGIAAIFAAVSVGNGPHRELGVPLAIGGVAAFLAGLITGVAVANPIAAARIDDDYIWLKGAHRDYLAALPEWPGKM